MLVAGVPVNIPGQEAATLVAQLRADEMRARRGKIQDECARAENNPGACFENTSIHESINPITHFNRQAIRMR